MSIQILNLYRERWPKFEQIYKKYRPLGRWNSLIFMHIAVLILLSLCVMSKVDYSSKARSYNVRDFLADKNTVQWYSVD
jgi:hypothetical protein